MQNEIIMLSEITYFTECAEIIVWSMGRNCPIQAIVVDSCLRFDLDGFDQWIERMDMSARAKKQQVDV